ncbi:hypothetical protein VIGAN_07166700 [Vigna angularis var. angularis]|uniref:Protein kinase domain-containing protein n=1 Tax=Vigna angularis var. angularis TaxID=157739 RepID=A0A0S3SJ87_PHAAN|nr:hypothetical protein VIGAN_07166700 [Vigna angularis var. angularis]
MSYHEAHQRAAKSVCSVCHNRRPQFERNRKKEFSYAELCAATQGFSPKNYLSEGGFGSVYKGELCGQKIAVKQHTYANQKGEKEFKSEVDVLSKAMHENVVMLLGSCSEGHHRLLVYEYLCNASLDLHLSQHSRKLLDWPDRVKVADGAAKGLLYLHENNIIHRDLTTNNILLTHDYDPLLGDFGLARTVIEDSSYCTECVGNMGYMAPEYAEFGKVSIKTDVYSFGVVLLQLITGMRTTDKRLGGKGLVEWITKIGDFRSETKMKTWKFVVGWVVDALTDIMEGKTCDTILRDYSPARSYSICSASETLMNLKMK